MAHWIASQAWVLMLPERSNTLTLTHKRPDGFIYHVFMTGLIGGQEVLCWLIMSTMLTIMSFKEKTAWSKTRITSWSLTQILLISELKALYLLPFQSWGSGDKLDHSWIFKTLGFISWTCPPWGLPSWLTYGSIQAALHSLILQILRSPRRSSPQARFRGALKLT
jgi:hypothetical protein